MNPDTLKKAVELADGWSLWDMDRRILTKELTPYFPHGLKIEHIPQWMIDALAAQLVRQVDELGNYAGVKVTPQYCEVFHPDKNTNFANKDDRTENTINAIVESGVLEKESKS